MLRTETQVMQEKLISAKTLANTLSTSVRTVWRLRSSGRLPKPVRIGSSVRWLESEISAWLQAGAPDRRTWNSMRGGK